MTTAKTGDRVRIHFLGRLEDGRMFDDSSIAGPLEFAIGEGEYWADLECAIVGMREGELKTVHVQADRAYGLHRQELVRHADVARFGTNREIKVGMRVRGPGRGQKPSVNFTITAIEGQRVTLDANHPLAGENLHIDVKLVQILKTAFSN